MSQYTDQRSPQGPAMVVSPNGVSWYWDGARWRPSRPPMPTWYYVLRALLAPVAFLLRIVGEILARALSCALSVVIGVFALGAVVALLALFLTHT